jgi:hypothetical protein
VFLVVYLLILQRWLLALKNDLVDLYGKGSERKRRHRHIGRHRKSYPSQQPAWSYVGNESS